MTDYEDEIEERLAEIAASLCMCGHKKSSHAFEMGRCLLCRDGECVRFDDGADYEPPPPATVERPCPGPVCKGTVQTFRYVGIAELEDGTEFHAYSCTGCETPPEGKRHAGIAVWDEDGNRLS